MRNSTPKVCDDCSRPQNYTTDSDQCHTRQPSLFDGTGPAVATETRRAAYRDALPKRGTRLSAALDALQAAGSRGLTRHELAEAMGLPLQSVCSIALQLRREGFAAESGKRTTPTGSMAAVLVATEDGDG